jgi:hypothetical protein
MVDNRKASGIMQSAESRVLISVRHAADRIHVPEQSLYRAIKRNTIHVAEGEDVPPGIWFDEPEFERWAARRHIKPGAPVRKGRRP